ncbi:hypothetical protein C8F01DRAFT_1140084 [Mycena amicta]|nr:hypothetical protein C8F01DRAFT_1190920 [Mycena amicta]KAJ7060590.1 hypothetical protein C8F01DRAFT_1140084 [Mycena amicta]
MRVASANLVCVLVFSASQCFPVVERVKEVFPVCPACRINASRADSAARDLNAGREHGRDGWCQQGGSVRLSYLASAPLAQVQKVDVCDVNGGR